MMSEDVATDHVNGNGTEEPVDTTAAVTHSEHFQTLLEAGLPQNVAEKLDEIYVAGLVAHSDLDERAINALKEMDEEGALQVLVQFKESDLSHVQNKSAFLCGVMKTYRQREEQELVDELVPLLKMAGKKELSADTRQSILALSNDGYSMREIAKKLKISYNGVYYSLHRTAQTGSTQNRRRSGRPRCTTEQEDKYIRVSSLRNRRLTGPQLAASLNVTRKTPVSSSTVKRRLQDAGLLGRVAKEKPYETGQ